MTTHITLPVAIGAAPHVLDQITGANCALAIWQRALPPDLAALSDLPHHDLDDVDVVIDVADATLSLAFHCGAAGYPFALGLTLAHDVAALVVRFAELTGQTRVKVRLEWVETDACRRFHVDAVTMRMISTYIGRGTQWRLASEPEGLCQTTAAGEILIVKGRALLSNPPVEHRSPPIVGTGERRLLLVVDAADFGA